MSLGRIPKLLNNMLCLAGISLSYLIGRDGNIKGDATGHDKKNLANFRETKPEKKKRHDCNCGTDSHRITAWRNKAIRIYDLFYGNSEKHTGCYSCNKPSNKTEGGKRRMQETLGSISQHTPNQLAYGDGKYRSLTSPNCLREIHSTGMSTKPCKTKHSGANFSGPPLGSFSRRAF